jgi:hypothetical protein
VNADLEELVRTQAVHPLYPLIDRDKLADLPAEDQRGLLEARAYLIAKEKAEPIHYGWEPPMWKEADAAWKGRKELLILGANRSGKSTYGAKRAVQLLMHKAGSIVWCFSTSFETSVRDQQRAIWQHLPAMWRGAKRGKLTNMTYTAKRGFTDKALVAPNGSECRFMNYLQDADIIEGGQVDLWWADELIPADWVVTLRSRTVDRRGRGLITQTPIRGYTPTIAEYVNGATVLRWADCAELPDRVCWPGGKPGKVPVEMECLNPRHAVMFFHTRNNPYVPYDELASAWKDKGTANLLCRLYGITSGISNCKFPRFGRHNILPHEKIPTTGANYQVIDFSMSKPWAMLWARVIEVADRKRIYIYREWPDQDSFGEWVLRSNKPDGAPGPAQAPLGYGIGDYRNLTRTLEGTERIAARFGDPRSGNAATMAEEGATTIFQLLEAEEAGQEGLVVEPVPGNDGAYQIVHGVNLVNSWLQYDDSRPIDPLNAPMLYVSERCQQTIDCLKMWTGADGDKGASKDFVDLLRYLALMDPSGEVQRKPIYVGGSY